VEPAEGADESAAAAAPERVPLMAVQVSTSCVYPLTAAFMFNQAVMWVSAHPRAFTLAVGRTRPMDPAQRYDEAAWRRHMDSAKRKVGAMAWALK
jgi:hypothetical protein